MSDLARATEIAVEMARMVHWDDVVTAVEVYHDLTRHFSPKTIPCRRRYYSFTLRVDTAHSYEDDEESLGDPTVYEQSHVCQPEVDEDLVQDPRWKQTWLSRLIRTNGPHWNWLGRYLETQDLEVLL